MAYNIVGPVDVEIVSFNIATTYSLSIYTAQKSHVVAPSLP